MKMRVSGEPQAEQAREALQVRAELEAALLVFAERATPRAVPTRCGRMPRRDGSHGSRVAPLAARATTNPARSWSGQRLRQPRRSWLSGPRHVRGGTRRVRDGARGGGVARPL